MTDLAKDYPEYANANEALFAKLVAAHDLTYAFSDDHRCWVAGRASADRIMELRKTIPWAVARRIWNANCDRKLVPDEAPRWYWPEKEPT